MAKRRSHDSVDFEELEELAALVHFKLTCDADYLFLFRVAKEQGWFEWLDQPNTDTKGLSVPVEGVPRLKKEGCLGGMDPESEPVMTKKGLTFTYPSAAQKAKAEKEQRKREVNYLKKEIDTIEACIAELETLGLKVED